MKQIICSGITAALCCFASLQSLTAQHSSFLDTDDARQRGYYDRPYKRYEAEPGSVNAYQGAFLPKTFDQREIQSEASNRQALQLNTVGDYVQWSNSESADGLTIRFSIPDNAAGTGTTGTVALYVNNSFVQNIELNSKWAWQYFFAGSSSYATNEPGSGRYARMRFDEVRVKLTSKIPAGATFKLVKVDEGAGAYTIDFVELEPIPARVEQPAEAVVYSGNGSDLVSFVASNGGRTIYIPEGEYDVPTRLFISVTGTKLIGAGMWHSQLHFVASPGNTLSATNNPGSYNARGIESNVSNVQVSGFYITTENDRRYADYISSGKQMGKGLNGSFGTNSVISDVWITHFECGAWINGTTGLQVSRSRFRDNYADGINLAQGSKNAAITRCSFRNNGDDDMASWSSNNRATENNVFQYNASENCWRAAGIGFFGGKQNKALNCVIIDPMEDGIRANDEFDGAPFSEDGFFELRNISIYNAGGKAGTRGQTGNLWGNKAAPIQVSGSSGKYNVRNFIFSDIDIFSSGGDAIMILGKLDNVFMKNITVNNAAVSTSGNGSPYYGISFSSVTGHNVFLCIDYQNMGDVLEHNTVPSTGVLYNTNCEKNTVSVRVNQTINLLPFLPASFAEDKVFSVINGTEYASIDAQGIVLGLSEGTAQVKAVDANNSANELLFKVIVKDIAVTGVTLPEDLQLTLEDTYYPLVATIVPDNATDKNITWATTNTNIVRVSAGGVLAARAVGTATITVTTTDGGYKATCVVTVTESNDISSPEADKLTIKAYGNNLTISGQEDDEIISVYNLLGTKVYAQQLGVGTQTISGLQEGIYVIVAQKAGVRQKVIIRQ